MTRRDESAPLAFKGMSDFKFGVAVVAVFGKIWGIYAIPQEEVVTPFLNIE